MQKAEASYTCQTLTRFIWNPAQLLRLFGAATSPYVPCVRAPRPMRRDRTTLVLLPTSLSLPCSPLAWSQDGCLSLAKRPPRHARRGCEAPLDGRRGGRRRSALLAVAAAAEPPRYFCNCHGGAPTRTLWTAVAPICSLPHPTAAVGCHCMWCREGRPRRRRAVSLIEAAAADPTVLDTGVTRVDVVRLVSTRGDFGVRGRAAEKAVRAVLEAHLHSDPEDMIEEHGETGPCRISSVFDGVASPRTHSFPPMGAAKPSRACTFPSRGPDA